MMLPAIPVAGPLLMAALLAALNRILRRRAASLLALAAALGAGAACCSLALAARQDTIVYWFGGWRPRGGIALGISFAIDPLGASLAALACALVAASLIFSWRYFDTVGTIYHVLILIFLAAMCGFSLTGDLFNLFVFFELMSASAFALCGYKSEAPGPLEGALNFAVVNTAGAFLALCGIALLYGRTGALNLAQIGRTLGTRADGLVVTAFVFLLAGFLTKAAVVPFHFWLADAHAVAPTPVCILFSGVMVELGLYAVARIYWTVFAGPLEGHAAGLRALLVGAGALTAVLGGVMSFAQRNLKRLLAFSTVSHMGIMVIGFGLLSRTALAGAAIYVAGHALIKAALFVLAGILLHRLGSVDEFALYGRGRDLRAVAVLTVIAALALAGLPPAGTFLGDSLIGESARDLGYGWISAISAFAAILSGGAVLRVAGRVFAGWGPRREEMPAGGRQITEDSETKGGHERVLPTMLLPAAVLTAAGLLLALLPGFEAWAQQAAARFQDHAGYLARVLDGAALPPPAASTRAVHIAAAMLSPAGALLLAAFTLFGRRLRDELPGMKALAFAVAHLRRLHSGVIGDYVTWFMAGVAALGALSAALLAG